MIDATFALPAGWETMDPDDVLDALLAPEPEDATMTEEREYTAAVDGEMVEVPLAKLQHLEALWNHVERFAEQYQEPGWGKPLYREWFEVDLELSMIAEAEAEGWDGWQKELSLQAAENRAEEAESALYDIREDIARDLTEVIADMQRRVTKLRAKHSD